MIVAQDHSGLNAGSFLIRNSDLMKLFVDLWSDALIVERTPSWAQKEQDALTHLIIHHPVLRERVGFVDQRLINGYVEGADEWKEGDLVLHFAGCWYVLQGTGRLIVGSIQSVQNGLIGSGGEGSCYHQVGEGK